MKANLPDLYTDHFRHLTSEFATALAATGFDAVVLDAGELVAKSRFDDAYYPFRAAASFAHWLPLVASGSSLVVCTDRRPTLVWMQPDSFWEQPAPPEHTEFMRLLDVVVQRCAGSVAQCVPTGRVAVLAETATRAAVLCERAEFNPPDLIAALDQLRSIKTQYEIASIAQANARAAQGHDVLSRAFAEAPASELLFHLKYLQATSQDDADAPYKNIVAIGNHCATLHHIAYHRGLPDRQNLSLLVDAGATCNGYHADITRTWLRGHGAAVDAFGGLIGHVDILQQQLCEAVQVGVPYEQLHDQAHLLVGQALRSVGLVRGSAEEAVAKDITYAFFPHGLGHSLGLQTHDVGCARIRPRADNPWLRNTSTMAVGQVLTIEPGIYFIDALLQPLRASSHAALVDWHLVDQLAQFGGIRIEDDIVVDAQLGHQNLTRAVLPVGGGRA